MDLITRQLVTLSRRGLLRGISATAAIAALQPVTSSRVWADPIFRTYPFSLGIASGDPLPDGVVIWTRLAPEPHEGGGMPAVAVPVRWEVAADSQFRTITKKGEALARPELGHSVHVEVSGLEPGRPYWYRFMAGRETSFVGRTKTAPAAGAMPQMVRFANLGCQRYEDGYFTAFGHAAKEDLDFAFHYGDYIYEYRNQRGPVQQVRDIKGDEIYTVVDYRNRYALYKTDPDLQAAHAAFPFLSSFDDHEIDNNIAGETSEEDESGRFVASVPKEIFALRRQMAFNAWYENMPVRYAALPRGPSINAYRRLNYGRLAQIDVLDTRQYRDDQPCGDITGPACPAVSNPNAQILGAAQEKWYLDGLASSQAVWKVMAQQVMVMARAVPNPAGSGEAFMSMDKWDAYPAARDRVLKHINDRAIKNLVVLTGDVHNAWAGEIKLDPKNPNSPTVGSEFVASSITTGGDGFDINDAFQKTLEINPHMKFINNRRGYSIHEATDKKMEVSFRAVDYVTRQGAPLVTKAKFAVEANNGGQVNKA
jgi:alkaline phosphatase D